MGNAQALDTRMTAATWFAHQMAAHTQLLPTRTVAQTMIIDGYRYAGMQHLRWHCPTHDTTFAAVDDCCPGIVHEECAPWVPLPCGCRVCLILNDREAVAA
jgi:hypothetical protein